MIDNELVMAILAALPALIPAVIKIAHSLGYELPWLTAISDWIANRPQLNGPTDGK